MITATGTALSYIDETFVPDKRRHIACIQALPEPEYLNGIAGHPLGGEKRILRGVVKDQLWATHRIGIHVTLVPGPEKHTFSVDMGLDGGVDKLFSLHKQSYLSTPKFILPLASDPSTGPKIFTLDLGERAADDLCSIPKKPLVKAMESADI